MKKFASILAVVAVALLASAAYAASAPDLLQVGAFQVDLMHLLGIGMTTLAADKARNFELGDIQELPMIAADIIYEGAAVPGAAEDQGGGHRGVRSNVMGMEPGSSRNSSSGDQFLVM